ncbi:MAG: family NAD(P)-dependent oxidoreductase [Frankiales bacterium]|nr:family NAD(P)-dependent oxidoreductase [Frankiales bacterium]
MPWLHDKLVHAPRAPRVDLTGKTVLVTGTTAGSLGDATARTLADWGADVVTTTRSGGSHPLDLTSGESVRAFVDWFTGNHDRLDVLVNNAGVHLDLAGSWKEPHLTADGHEIHWRTNYLGTMQLTHLLLPALLRTAEVTGEARIVNVVSKLHTRGRNEHMFNPAPTYSSWNAYGQSKLAMVHATHELQDHHRAAGVRSYALHPGSVYTGIATKGLEEKKLLSAVRRRLAPIERLFLLTADEGAQTTLMCATEPDLEGGRYFAACKVTPGSNEAEDRDTAGRLWKETLELVPRL